ncbi:MAG: flagellar motor switch protein FliN [Planctomycetota bacterium]
MANIPEEIKKEIDNLEKVAKEEIEKTKTVMNVKELILTPLLESAPKEVAENIKLIKDIELEVSIEVGKTKLSLGEIAKLTVGSVVQLNKLAGDPVDIYVNNQLIAKGQIVVFDDNFSVRIIEFIKPEE